MAGPLSILGIRHHGPGCARSVVEALEALQPAVVLVEGPADADELIPVVAQEGLRPPVALLVHHAEDPRQSVFYPFAEFSPEWQALRWAVAHGVPVRFMDLPWQHRFALRAAAAEQTEPSPKEARATPVATETEPAAEADELREDPLLWLAKADGYSDGERWWNDRIEERADANGLFAAILEAMTALRTELGDSGSPLERQREAWMRRVIRETQREVLGTVAVVCGAWHAPVLANPPKVGADNELLRGLPKAKVGATWVPWTHQRLCSKSGYGAGISSPGWYEHLWQHRRDPALSARWLARVAQALRGRQLDASTAQVIDGVRLAEQLAAFRGRPIPGLAELDEAVVSVFCNGDTAPLALVGRHLHIGERLGEVPEGVARLPLQQDIEATQRRLRLKPAASQTVLELDLREENGLSRSHFLHRLALLGIPWGRLATSAGKGTFKEAWRLEWKPEFAVSIIDAARHGNTIESAATTHVCAQAAPGAALETLCTLLETTLLADLPQAGAHLVTRIGQEAAQGDDVQRLAGAVPPLARIARYGNVRQVDATQVVPILGGLVARVLVGLPTAVAGIDDDAATAWLGAVRGLHAALVLLESEWLGEWHEVLARLVRAEPTHPLLAGASVRLLLDAGKLADGEAARLLAHALSRGQGPVRVAAWLEGFLAGNATALVHDETLLPLLETWVATLPAETFTETLPLLRRTFSTFCAPERSQLAARLGQTRTGASTAPLDAPLALDPARTAQALPIVLHLLGREPLTSANAP